MDKKNKKYNSPARPKFFRKLDENLGIILLWPNTVKKMLVHVQKYNFLHKYVAFEYVLVLCVYFLNGNVDLECIMISYQNKKKCYHFV